MNNLDRDKYLTEAEQHALRDKFLTEKLGECWHVGWRSFGYRDEITCDICKQDFYDNPDFSSWEGFGKLWEWARLQQWFWEGFYSANQGFQDLWIINPDRFADVVYSYLKEHEQ